MSSPRRTLVALLAALALAVAAGACSRESSVDDAASATTEAVDTTSVPAPVDTTAPTDTTATAETIPSSSDPSATEETTDVFGNTETENATYRAAYRAAFEAECGRIWATYAGADGILADPDFPEDPYVVDDCTADLDDSWGEFAGSVDEARASGTDDAQIAASDLADPLCDSSGTRCFSYGD